MTIRASILRVYLSSPGDVAEERRLLRGVLDRVPRDPLLRERVYLEPVAYDDPDAPAPMSANEPPQQSVNRYKPHPSECDLTVVVLWSRFGTRLPVDKRKPDGSRYESGTEWEYEDALRAGKTVWVYYRRTPPSMDPGDPGHAEKVAQRAAVERFIGRFTNPDGSLARGYTVYDAPEALSERFEQHLKAYLREQLDGPRGKATTFRMGALAFPSPSPDLDRHYIDFGRELDAGKELVGRRDPFARLADFAASHSRGYFRVTADAGLGKTTFAAAVTRQRNAAAFFANASRGLTRADQCVNHLCAQLIARFGLPVDLPPNSGESSAFLDKILAESVARSNEPLWLVVDGLDEADEAAGRNVLLLPASLPNGVYCLITQAPGDYPLLTLPGTPVVGLEIASDSPSQQADVDEYLGLQLARPEIAERVGKRDAVRLHERLREASQGNFRYVSYLLADIAAGELPADTDDLPQGLRSYYEATWARMDASAEAKGGKESKRLYRSVVGLLAVAREPVTLGWLAELSGQPPADIRDEVFRTWRRYLSRERRGRIERWRFPDRSFGDFLADTLALGEQHASVAAHYRPEPAWRKHEGYGSRHLTTHLRLAGDMDGLASLVDDAAWCESQLLVDPTGAAYQNDLMQACRGAFTTDQLSLEEGGSAGWLGREVGWGFAAATLRAYWFNVWPAMLAEFVSARILTEAQVVAWATRIPKDFDRGRALGVLAPVLSPAFRRRAITVLRAMGEEGVHDLLDFADQADGEERSGLITEALSLAETMPDDDAATVPALAHIAETEGVSSEQRDAVLRRAADIAGRLDDGTERVEAFLSLVPVSPTPSEPLGGALTALRTLEDPSQASERIDLTFGRIPETDAVALARVMVDVSGRIPDRDFQLDWMQSALRGLDRNERSKLLSAIRELAESIADPESRAHRLLALSDLASGGERSELLEGAEAAIGLMPDGVARSILLCTLAARMSGERALPLWRDSVARLVEQSGATAAAGSIVALATSLPERSKQAGLAAAEAVVRDLPDSMPKARLLIELAQACDEETSRRLVAEAVRIPGGVLAAGVQAPDQVELLELVGALGQRLPVPSRELLVRRARPVADGVTHPYARGRALAALLPISTSEEHRQIVDAVRAAADIVRAADERTELLLAVLADIDPGEREAVIEEAAASARAIEPGGFFLEVTVNAKTLVTTSPPIPELRACPSRALLKVALQADGRRHELLDESYRLVFDHPAHLQAAALAALAPHLSADVTTATIAGVRTLLLDPQRRVLRGVLEELVRTPTPPVQADSDEGVGNGGDDDGEGAEGPSYGVALPDDWLRLDGGGPTPVIVTNGSSDDPGVGRRTEIALEDVIGIGRAFLASMSQKDLDRAHGIVEAAARAWRDAMGPLLRRLAEVASPAAALREARATWPDGPPPSVCAALLPLLEGEEKNRLLEGALAASQALETPEDRASAWLGLYPHVRGTQRDTALARITESLNRVEAKRVAELAATAWSAVPGLSRLDLRRLVHRVLHSIDERGELARCLQPMVPLVEALAGRQALSESADALLATRERWV